MKLNTQMGSPKDEGENKPLPTTPGITTTNQAKIDTHEFIRYLAQKLKEAEREVMFYDRLIVTARQYLHDYYGQKDGGNDEAN